MRVSRSRTLLGAAVLAALTGCGSDSPTIPTDVAQAVIAVTVKPNPITAPVTNAVGPIYTAGWTVIVTETAGLGGMVTAVKSSVYDAATGALVGTYNYDDKDLLVFVGTNRIEGKGSIEVPQQLSYVLSAGKTSALLTVVVNFRDDKQHAFETSILVKIN